MSTNSVSVNYYSVLGVARDASTKEINVAFKRLALRLHPDKSGGDRAAIEQFHRVRCDPENICALYQSGVFTLTREPLLIAYLNRPRKQSRPSVTLSGAADTMKHSQKTHSLSTTMVKDISGDPKHTRPLTIIGKVNGTIKANAARPSSNM